MSRHLNAPVNSIAPYVLICGNPQRTKGAALKYLRNPQLVSDNRGALVYTGEYKNLTISIATSGMGMASIGIYAHELFVDYDVKAIIRIGTAGGYEKNVEIFDVYNPGSAFSESNGAQGIGFKTPYMKPDPTLFQKINETAHSMNQPVKNGRTHSSDVFYGNLQKVKQIHVDEHCEIVEMESFALWAVAKQQQKQAATLLLVSDLVLNVSSGNTVTNSTFAERIQKTATLFKIALQTFHNLFFNIEKKQK